MLKGRHGSRKDLGVAARLLRSAKQVSLGVHAQQRNQELPRWREGGAVLCARNNGVERGGGLTKCAANARSSSNSSSSDSDGAHRTTQPFPALALPTNRLLARQRYSAQQVLLHTHARPTTCVGPNSCREEALRHLD